MNHETPIEKNVIPQHVAIIMDGNGRWARKHGSERIFGHQNAITSVRESTEFAAEKGIEYLTLFAFSTENWGRPSPEVQGLMSLLVETIKNEMKTLMDNNVRLNAIGELTKLPDDCRESLKSAIHTTSKNNGLVLTLALNYSGKWDILQAVKKLSEDLQKGELEDQRITEQLFEEYLSTINIPDPELLIRTSGELRISNFLLWQLAYTELYITDVLWPDFRKDHFKEAILNFQKRERRFGKINP